MTTDKTNTRYTLRSTALNGKGDNLSVAEVRKMLKKYDFYCNEGHDNKAWANPSGQGIQHKYMIQNNDLVIFDASTGLHWQKSGSSSLQYEEAEAYISKLNENKFAGYDDWSLPTLEEAMSLIESEKKKDRFIDNLFDNDQLQIWTDDDIYIYSEYTNWIVSFNKGYCLPGSGCYCDSYYVRAVRGDHRLVKRQEVSKPGLLSKISFAVLHFVMITFLGIFNAVLLVGKLGKSSAIKNWVARIAKKVKGSSRSFRFSLSKHSNQLDLDFEGNLEDEHRK